MYCYLIIEGTLEVVPIPGKFYSLDEARHHIPKAYKDTKFIVIEQEDLVEQARNLLNRID